ncbi:hypothetical protein ACHWQZ_G001153 [Mnemiopsis leidyi]
MRFQVHRITILIAIFLAICDCEYEFDLNEIPDYIPPMEGDYMLSALGDNCLNTCFDAGYESCLANLETSEYGGEAANALWDLVPGGEFSIFTNYLWTEPYHPMVEFDGLIVGWEAIPQFGGSCTAFPPDMTQRRLCRCGNDLCEDKFKFCRALTWVCHKYPYTQRSCPLTCEVCHVTGWGDYFLIP